MNTLALPLKPSYLNAYTQPNISSVIEQFFRPITDTPSKHTFESDVQQPSTLPEARATGKALIEEQLSSFTRLPVGWDGYEGVPASFKTADEAKAFVERLPLTAKLPRPMIAGNGDISICWEDGDKYLEVSFSGDGTFHYFFDAPAPIDTCDDLPIKNGIPDRLRTIVLSHFV